MNQEYSNDYVFFPTFSLSCYILFEPEFSLRTPQHAFLDGVLTDEAVDSHRPTTRTVLVEGVIMRIERDLELIIINERNKKPG